MTDLRIIWKLTEQVTQENGVVFPMGQIIFWDPSPRGRFFSTDKEAWFDAAEKRLTEANPHFPHVRLPDCLFEELPTVHFHNCWRDDGTGKVVVDMPLARTQRLREIRTERDRRFAPLDNEWMKATGQGNKAEAEALEAKRQALRDIPQNIDLEAVTTPEALEAFEPNWPEKLDG